MYVAHPRARGRFTLCLMILVAALVAPTASVSAARPQHPTAVTLTQAKPTRIERGLVATAKEHGFVRVIVNFRRGVSAASLRSPSVRTDYRRALHALSNRVAHIATTTGGQVARRYTYLPAIVLYATPRTIAGLRASSAVASVAADGRATTGLNESVPIVQGNTMAAAGWGGTNQIVAVLDTGAQTDHPFLAGKTVGEACFAAGDPAALPVTTGDCPNGLETDTDPGSAAPCTWAENCQHGTHVAGIAIGKLRSHDGPTGGPVTGVARNAWLLPIQVFSAYAPTSGITTYWSDQAAALDYVVGHETWGARHVAAVNMSIVANGFGTSTNCDTVPVMIPIKAAIDLLRADGIATVVSAGNDRYVAAMTYPACISSVISVASSTKADQISDFSDLDSLTSIIAPGTAIYSSVPGGTYALMDGTSMAAPHVAGAWAEIKSRFPNASVDIVLRALRSTGRSITDQRLPGSTTFTRITKRRIRILNAGVWLGTTVTALKSSASSVTSGRNVTLTATETHKRDVGMKPTGKVVFKVGGKTVASRTISNSTGKATYSAKITGPKGSKVTVQAFYQGAGPFLKSRSVAIKVTIK